MSLQQIKRDIQELRAAAEVKKALPWDYKNLMGRCHAEISRREILCQFYDITGVAYEVPGPYRLEVENQSDLSREARVFLSFSAEEQAVAVAKYYQKRHSTEYEDSITWEDAINKVGGLEEFEHRLTRGCKWMKIEPLNIRQNLENDQWRIS